MDRALSCSITSIIRRKICQAYIKSWLISLKKINKKEERIKNASKNRKK
ncbi:Uncharacterised protein [Campylobacter hyointestinalis subsp. hyointestinalis]|uniref:Uncharacterized protein n=1 Tax=Campylobacter hyointestinalis subsp. hyointestinalis TaxID=91352 RepID=A0A0S4SB63_CAMHY|nr:Uncharacterised protein [Campylobacter hyointestinalis subsp. hyointestinalis]CUU83520.1 Uncharacterised protein [Campylobacter hyointestinalis subsp. hyointestinalis]CUU88642.1 Uncharacterised protein [Campylobacter hyointestinalis subsp. hyointestinalis]